MSADILVQVEGVRKKFCRSLKRSLWYGVQDVAAEALGRTAAHDQLRRDEFWAVNDVSFELRRGECLGLIGRNGAGKTTMLKMLNGLIRPDAGRIRIRGRVGALIALGAGFNPILTGRENIYVNGSVLGLSKRQIDAKLDEIIDFAELREFIDTPVQSYSSGMQVRLGFAVATAMNPDVLILDEVLAVGDFAFQAKCLARIAEIKERAALLFVSHNLHQLSIVCDSGVVLKQGRMIAHGDISSALESYCRDTGSTGAAQAEGRFDWTSGEVQIAQLAFHDQQRERLNGTVSSGQPFELVIEVRNTTSATINLIVDIRVEDSLGTILQNSSESQHASLALRPGGQKIRVGFPPLHRHGDQLRVNAALWSRDARCILAWTRGHALTLPAIAMNTGRDYYPLTFRLTDD